MVRLLITKLKGLLLSVLVKKLKSANIWQSYEQERGCLVHFAHLANTLLKDEESARDNHVQGPVIGLAMMVRPRSSIEGSFISTVGNRCDRSNCAQAFASNVIHPRARLAAGIVTDRLSCNSQIISEANQLKDMSVTLFGVAITSTGAVDTGCMQQIVTRNQVIVSSSYNELSSHVHEAIEYGCVAPFCKYSVTSAGKVTGKLRAYR